jgi:phage terminase small subunit
MVTKQKQKKQTQEQNDETLLKEIVELGRDIKSVSESLLRLRERKDDLLQEAVNRKITRAGDFKLITKERVSRKVDMAAIESLLTADQFKQIAHCTLKDAEQFLTKKQIEKVTSKEVSLYYLAQEIYKPKELE